MAGGIFGRMRAGEFALLQCIKVPREIFKLRTGARLADFLLEFSQILEVMIHLGMRLLEFKPLEPCKKSPEPQIGREDEVA